MLKFLVSVALLPTTTLTLRLRGSVDVRCRHCRRSTCHRHDHAEVHRCRSRAAPWSRLRLGPGRRCRCCRRTRTPVSAARYPLRANAGTRPRSGMSPGVGTCCIPGRSAGPVSTRALHDRRRLHGGPRCRGPRDPSVCGSNH